MSGDGCEGCDHLVNNPYDGHCYMFREKLSDNCAQHTSIPRLPPRAARAVVMLECLNIMLGVGDGRQDQD